MKRLLGCSAALAAVLALAANAQTNTDSQWMPVKSGKLCGISGMARIETVRPSFLVAHDNKKADQTRFAIVSVSPGGTLKGPNGPVESPTTTLYIPLAWPPDIAPPVDLEALTQVPGAPDTFLALASAGDVSQVRLVLGEQRVEQVGSFRLPGIKQDDNYEGIALCRIGGKLVIAWGRRGEGTAPGVLHWGFIELPSGTVTATASTDIVVPWPSGANLRHISDLVIDQQGTVYASAASSEKNKEGKDDDGPFDGAIYRIGSFVTTPEGLVTFQKLEEPAELYRGPGYKIEGIVLMPGATPLFAAGTDDENKGSSLLLMK